MLVQEYVILTFGTELGQKNVICDSTHCEWLWTPAGGAEFRSDWL